MKRYGNLIWEGLSTETKPTVADGAGDLQFFKELDTGDTYERQGGEWINISAGLSFIKASKSGRITTGAGGTYAVVFGIAFKDDAYTVALSCQDNGSTSPVIVTFSALTAAGFTITTRNARTGLVVGGIVVSWLATRNYDPTL